MNHAEKDQAPHRALRELLAAPAEISLDERFPIMVEEHPVSAREVLEILNPFLTERRKVVLANAVNNRTYSIIPVVEGLVNVGNVSAVVRSAEAMGYQEFQVITGGGQLKQSERTSQGAEKWLDLKTWETPHDCVKAARNRGYQVVAMHLDEGAAPIQEIDFTLKTALVFGNEASGVSMEMLQLADRTCIIPLDGLTESFNVSVAAAISLYQAKEARNKAAVPHADLPNNQRTALLADFYLRSVGKSASSLLHRLVKERASS